MWDAIRRTHPVASYWGVDVKPKKGRLKIDSVRVLQQGVSQNVIDIDTYGSPWKQWFALLPNLVKPTTVFLTIGQISIGGSQLSNESRAVLGIRNLQIPPAIQMKLHELAVEHCLYQGDVFCKITEAVEVSSTGNARYIGVRLEPKENRPPSSAVTCKQTQIVKGS